MCRITWTRAVIFLTAIVWLPMGGCVITVDPINNPPATPTTITVRIVNNTTKALDPQIYIAAADVGADNLFQAQYKRTNFGVGNLGTLLPGTSATFSVQCGQLGLVGTQGGIFGDDLNNPLDQGDKIVLQENVSVQCGYQIEFRFDQRLTTLINTYSVTLAGG